MRLFISLVLLLQSSLSLAETCHREIKPDSPVVEWTAYKFTEKKAVKGQLKDLHYKTSMKAKTPVDLLTRLTFSIDPMKVDSGDVARDLNLRERFFKLLKTPLITGVIKSATKDSAIVTLKMNGQSKDVPFKLVIDEKSVVAEGEIDVLDFAMQKSMEELHKACEGLHKGADGVSKTWSTVGLKISAEHLEVCK